MSSRHHQLNRRRWAAVRRRVLDRDGWRCQACGKAGRLEVDHVEPLWRTPDQNPYRLEGLQALCRNCHLDKSRAEHSRHVPADIAAWRELLADL